MKKLFFVFITTVVMVWIFSCERENIEDKYYSSGEEENPTDTVQSPSDTSTVDPTDTIPQIIHGEIAWFPMNGNLNDSTENNISLMLMGDTVFVDGINEEYKNGLYLNGYSYLLLNLGYYDTLSIVFWIKGDGEIESTNSPVLFDYGFNAFSAQLDASTGATSITVKKNDDIAYSHESSSVEYLNSFYQYSFVYVEAGGNKTRVYFKGYSSLGDELIYCDELNFPGIIEAESEFLYIGRSSQRENQSESFFRGAIDEIHIYNKTLSNAEVESMALISTQ